MSGSRIHSLPEILESLNKVVQPPRYLGRRQSSISKIACKGHSFLMNDPLLKTKIKVKSQVIGSVEEVDNTF